MAAYFGIFFVESAQLASDFVIVQSHIDGQLFARAQVGVIIFCPDAWIRTATLQQGAAAIKNAVYAQMNSYH